MKKYTLLFLLFIISVLTVFACAKAVQTEFKVDPDFCNSCGICVQNCPRNAIEIIQNKALIDQTKCIKCGKCASYCPQKAVN